MFLSVNVQIVGISRKMDENLILHDKMYLVLTLREIAST